MVKTRALTKNDLTILSEIYAEVYKVFDVGERWMSESAYKLLEYWFLRQPDLAFVAEFNGKIVGAFIVGVKPWWDGYHLTDGEIFVHPEYQKHGIGSELLKVVFKKAIEKYNATAWYTITFKGATHPLSWYKSLGFSETEEWVMISGDIRKALSILENK